MFKIQGPFGQIFTHWQMTVHPKFILSDSVKKSPEIVSKYQAGFSECASEVTSYLNQTSDLEPEIKANIVSHLSQCKKRIADSVSLTTSMHPKEFKRHRQDSDSDSSDEENIPIKRTYCDTSNEQKEQQSPQIPLQGVHQHYSTGLLQLPTGVQVVLIPKDLLLNSNTCVKGISHAILPTRDMSNDAPSSCNKDNVNQSSSSDSEPDSTMPCDTVLEVKITSNFKDTNNIANSTQETPQENALDLSAQRNIEQTESMWRPW